MKNIIYLIVLTTIIFGCAKELDETTSTTTIEEPSIIDAYLIKSIVLDNTDRPISEAIVEFVSEDYNEITYTDSEGQFFIELPTETTEGYIQIFKEKHNPVILKFTQGYDLPPALELRSNQNLDTKPEFSILKLYTVEGRFVYPNGDPAGDVKYSGIRWHDEPVGKPVYLTASFITGADGRFSIVVDSLIDDYNLEINGTALTDRCLQSVGISLYIENSYTDVGDLVYDRIYEESITTKVTAIGCTEDLTAKIYLPAQRPLGLFDEALGNIAAPYCPNYPKNNVYIGVENAAGDAFNGGFYSELLDDQEYNYDTCLPSEYFFELTRGLDTSYYQVQYDTTNNAFIFTDPNVTLSYEIDEWYSNSCTTSSCGTKEFHFTKFTEFQMTDNNDPANDNKQIGGIFMDNVQNNESLFSGIISSVTKEFKIRFKVLKV